jgi:uncharacterized protein YjiS (DUF1127 family)
MEMKVNLSTIERERPALTSLARLPRQLALAPSGLPDFFRRVLSLVRLWRERARTRRQLCQLDEYELHDIGLTRSAAQWEAAKPFWR